MSNSSTSPPSLAKAGLTSSSKTCCMSVIFCKLVNVFTSNSGILASEDKSLVNVNPSSATSMIISSISVRQEPHPPPALT